MARGRGARAAAASIAAGAVVSLATACSGSPAPASSPAQDYRAAMALLVAQGLCADPQYAGDESNGTATATCRTGGGELVQTSPGTAPVTFVGGGAAPRVVRGSTWTAVAPSLELAERAASITGGAVQGT